MFGRDLSGGASKAICIDPNAPDRSGVIWVLVERKDVQIVIAWRWAKIGCSELSKA